MKYGVWLSMIVVLLILTGCSLKNVEQSPVLEERNDTLGLTPDFSYEVKEQTPRILVNQVGYLKAGKKVAILQGENLEEVFYVYNATTGEVEYQGNLKHGTLPKTAPTEEDIITSNSLYLADFSLLENLGNYYLYHPDLGYSYGFRIGTDVYEDLEKKALTLIGKEKNNTALMCYQLMGLLVSKELYGDKLLEPKRLEALCRQKVSRLFLAQDQVTGSVYADIGEAEKLQEMNEAEKQQLISLTATAEFAGAMAAYALEMQGKDEVTAVECQLAAEKAYRSIQTSLDNVGYDAGYFAVTQLYRLTGRAQYHQAIEQYLLLKEEQKRYTEYDFSLFADYAYLSNSHGVNLEWSDFIMKKLMKQAEEISLTGGKNTYYVSPKREYYDFHGMLYDMSNLAVVNYIITNHEYSTLQKNYMDYFLGRNPDNVCHVEGFGSRNGEKKQMLNESNGVLFYLFLQGMKL